MKELTYEDWQKNPTPRMMWVWDNDEKDMLKMTVVYIIPSECNFPVVALGESGNIYRYRHCAEIGKQRRMTNQELSWWLRDNSRREFKYLNDGFVYFEYSYLDNEDSTLIEDDILIRENGGEWHEPLVEVEE